MSSTSRQAPTAGQPVSQQDPPRLSWDHGTAYDFFMSLLVLHNPEDYGLRPSWAAGVRSRLPPTERKMLEDLHDDLWVPMHWIYTLPEPKDAATVLWALRQIPPAQRPLTLVNMYEVCEMAPQMEQALRKVVDTRSWDQHDLDIFKSFLEGHKKHQMVKDLPAYLDWYARPDELGELIYSALLTYYQVFFEEEEKRIAPVLDEGLSNAQKLAQELSLRDLLADLSQGVHMDISPDVREIVLVPGYWNTPLIVFPRIAPDKLAIMFGTRPADMSLVSGEPVPDTLLRMLKALADPTRLSILHYLGSETLTQAQLSRRLRLRAPTVTHHLTALRMAGLVHVTLEAGGEKLYAARLEAIPPLCGALERYLTGGSGAGKAVSRSD